MAREKQMKIKSIIFDFDGVIIDSEEWKRSAWFHVFVDSNDSFAWSRVDLHSALDEAFRLWIDDGAKGSRFEIIEHVMNVAHYPKTNEAISRYAKLYGSAVQNAFAQLGIKKTTLDAVRKLASNYALYINSGTPEAALLQSVDDLGISRYFKGIYGKTNSRYENSKVQNLLLISKQENISPAEMLFIGDRETDYSAAREVGCQFIRYRGGSFEVEKSWTHVEPSSIRSFDELDYFLD